MKKIAIIERIEKYGDNRPFKNRYILNSLFREIAD